MFDRITFSLEIMGARACIRGMRVTVSLVVNLVANGMSTGRFWMGIRGWRGRTLGRRWGPRRRWLERIASPSRVRRLEGVGGYGGFGSDDSRSESRGF